MDNTLFEQVDRYISDLLAPEDPALTNTIEQLETQDIPNMSISPNQGKMLQVFARMCNAKKILEMGTLAGYSTIWMARALPTDGKLISIEYEDRYADVAEKNIQQAGVQHIVEIKRGKALDILPQLESENAGAFDMIFIDADKPPYVEYFEYALRMSRPGTIIIADNVIRNGKVLDGNTEDEKVKGVQRFNKWLSTCTDITATILQTVGIKEYDGMAIAVVN